MSVIYKEVEVNIDEFDTQDIIKELELRGAKDPHGDTAQKDLIEKIWMKRRTGNQDYQKELDDLIWAALGKIS